MKKLFSILKYGLLLGVSALLMWYALKELDFEKMWAELQNANYGWVGISLLMGVAAYLSRAYRWQMQIKPTGYQPSLHNTYNAMMVGYIANLVLPRMGEVVRCSMLRRSDGIPVNKGFGTVIAERFVDMLMLLLAIAITFLSEFRQIKDFFRELFSSKYSNLEQTIDSLYWVAGFFLLSAIVIVLVGLRYLSRLRENSFFQKAVQFVKGMLQGVFSITKLDNQAAFWGHTFFVWLMYYGMSLVVFYALPGTSNLGYGAALSVLVVGSLGMAAPVQGGVGVYHLLVQATLLLYGVPAEAGMAYALLAHTSQTLLVVIMGVLSFIAGMLRKPGVVAAPDSKAMANHELN
ncbi:flippase-like domain-containing protein [Pontibacter sp. BT310]|uniref:Flippase-like domain-containing protein n=1 Tax=Pontibacter populi TaxID=890055 RepID=A0ABS6XB53_9BACT|nr:MULTISPECIES: lysylphosphatidylglycerol synthase transmembrane domain-containing protein [Pontibacter]MBJ6117562.1 flippase-like domain-containing protein [Pontibacter sp. BT310]MBR0569987.1 flippase-like domain-containing protein [Microvirga sp. STS03]MBW3364415.1 flippase-like domain-containing protein [Pontibacter populi]